jgi:hypothetical protein
MEVLLLYKQLHMISHSPLERIHRCVPITQRSWRSGDRSFHPSIHLSTPQSISSTHPLINTTHFKPALKYGRFLFPMIPSKVLTPPVSTVLLGIFVHDVMFSREGDASLLSLLLLLFNRDAASTRVLVAAWTKAADILMLLFLSHTVAAATALGRWWTWCFVVPDDSWLIPWLESSSSDDLDPLEGRAVGWHDWVLLNDPFVSTLSFYSSSSMRLACW